MVTCVLSVIVCLRFLLISLVSHVLWLLSFQNTCTLFLLLIASVHEQLYDFLSLGWGVDYDKDLSFVWGVERKIWPRITVWLAEWCHTVIARDGFFYLPLIPMIDSFSCTLFISERRFLWIMQSLRLLTSAILWWHYCGGLLEFCVIYTLYVAMLPGAVLNVCSIAWVSACLFVVTYRTLSKEWCDCAFWWADWSPISLVSLCKVYFSTSHSRFGLICLLL